MIASCIRENCRHIPSSTTCRGPLPSRVEPLGTVVSASCTRVIGRATVLDIPEGVLRARPLPLRVEPLRKGRLVSCTRGIRRALYVPCRTGKRSDDAELHAREIPSVLEDFEEGSSLRCFFIHGCLTGHP